MQAEQYHYPRSIHNMIQFMGHVLTGVRVYKYTTGVFDPADYAEVPVAYKDADMLHSTGNSQALQQQYSSIPRISYFLKGIKLNAERIISPIDTRALALVDDKTKKDTWYLDFTPLPYDYTFGVTLIANTPSELGQMVENTVCYFAPMNTTARMREWTDINLERDIPMTLIDGEIKFSEINTDTSEIFAVKAEYQVVCNGQMYRPRTSVPNIRDVSTIHFNMEKSVGNELIQ